MKILLLLLAPHAAPPAALDAAQTAKWAELNAVMKRANEARARVEIAACADLADQVIAGCRVLYGDVSWPVAVWLHNAALARHSMGDVEKAAALWRASAAAYTRMHGPGHWKAVNAEWEARGVLAHMTPARKEALAEAVRLSAEAHRLQAEGKYGEALPHARRALAGSRAAVGDGHPRSAGALALVVRLLWQLGDYEAALPLARDAVKLSRRVWGDLHPNHATCLAELRNALHSLGADTEAIRQHRRGLAIIGQAYGEWHVEYGVRLGSVAYLLGQTGDHRAAIPLAARGLEVIRATAGEKHTHHASALSVLADLHADRGDFQAALPPMKRSVAIRKEVQGGRHPEYAASLNALAVMHNDMGDREGAVALFRRALEIYRATLGRKHPHSVTALHNLGSVLFLMRQYDEATTLVREALKIRKEMHGEKHPDYVHALNTLASLHQAKGEHRDALALFRRIEKAMSESGARGIAHAHSLHHLALQLKLMGRPREALPLYEKALGIIRAAHGPRHPFYAETLRNIAVLHQDNDAPAEARKLAEQALEITLARQRDSAAVQSDRQQLAAADDARHALDVRLALPDATGSPSAAAHALAWKGTVLLRQQERRLFLRLTADAQTQAAAERLRSATRRLAALRLSPAATGLDELGREQEEAQAELSRLSADFRAARVKERLTPETLAKALPEGAVLVDFLFHWAGGIKDRPDAVARGERRLSAYVHRRGAAPARLDLGAASAIESAASKWRADLIARRAGGGAVLRRLLWAPLERHLADAKVILISPDGVLGTVPFAALPGRKAGSYLIEDVAVAVVPVPRAIPDMLTPVKKEDRLPPSLLVVGDLRYDPAAEDARPSGPDSRGAPRPEGLKFPPLRATRGEIAAVKAAFADLPLFKGGVVTDLRAGRATKPAVREALGKVRYAHLATHGFFSPAQGAWHPLLLSGLALSGANRRPGEGEEDGILTALEVSEMDLSRLELAVLSACETGLGKEAGGEGLLGLQRAFQVAGARSVVSSLWKVDDRATQQLMTDFYAAAWDTEKVISRAEALRQAQLVMLREGVKRGTVGELEAEKGTRRAPPYYWAGFALSGDWR